jgi:Fungal chitosanase of glycosyl hydrolase group 75
MTTRKKIRSLQQIMIHSISLILFPSTIAYFIPAAKAEPTASELTSLTQTCTPLAGVGKFSSDEGRPSQIQMCQLKGAIWFKADMDIDCDGGTTQVCKDDDTYLPETSCNTSLGKPMDASNIPFIVLPQPSHGWNESNYRIRCGTVGAVIFNGKLEYGVFGDRGPEGVLGEASYAMAKRLGINADPNTGGISTGVTYIVFTGSSAVVQPIEDTSKSIGLGKRLGVTLIAQNSLPHNTSTVKLTKPTNRMTFSIGTPISFGGTADPKVIKVKLIADNQWTLAEVPVNQGSWSATYNFAGIGDRQIKILGFDSLGKQIAVDTMSIIVKSDQQ